MRILIGTIAAITSVLFVVATTPSNVSANTALQFSAENIISDNIFSNSGSMTVDDIQRFLNSKVPACDTNGTKRSELGGGTRAQWLAARGISTPITCLKDYYENPATKENNYGKSQVPSGALSAAQIVYSYSRQFNINPQVILVTFQKENGLVTDEWPTPRQYSEALGFGCPDNIAPGAPACDPAFKSFSSQVYQAARHFRGYMDNQFCNGTWCTPYTVGQNLIRWQDPRVNASCGSSTVNIQNRATSALYSYTPYRPNQAALNAGYGVGDGCSAYGNRNFFLYFTDWFGSTRDPDLSWQVVSQTIYDESKSSIIPTDFLRKNERVIVSLKVKNTGTETWFKNGPTPIRLGIEEPRDSTGMFCDTTWLSCNRVASIVEDSIAPGAEGHFEFYLKSPDSVGEFRQYMTPLLENRGWMKNSTGFSTYIKTNHDYSWQWNSFDAWTDSTKTQRVDMNNVSRGQNVFIELYAKNTSATVWTKDGATPTRLGTSQSKDRQSQLCIPTQWLNCARPALMDQERVAPGQVARFSFTIKAPSQPGEYRESFQPVVEFLGWTKQDFNHIYLKVL